MFTEIFTAFIFQPLYNSLIFLVGEIPGSDIGIAVVLLTILVKLVILPLSHHSVRTQAGIRKLDPEIQKIKERLKDNQQEQAAQIMQLYKKHGVNPFSGCLITLIQMPIIIGLYWVFWKGLAGGTVNPDLLYSFISLPQNISFEFLGLVDLNKRSIIFALLAALSQFYLMSLSVPPASLVKNKTTEKKQEFFGDEFKKNLTNQMRYTLPVVVGVVSVGFPAVIPLYWATSNIFSVIHELLVRREANKLLKEQAP